MIFPAIHQITATKNPSYLNSLWLGISAPIINLPTIVWNLIVLPLFLGIAGLIQLLIVIPVAGILGRCTAVEITEEDAIEAAYKRFVKNSAPR